MIAFVMAQVESLEDAAPVEAQTLDAVILGEQFYFFTVVLMWLIHVGFMSYEAGVVRREERARHGDEEHPHDRRRHAELLLLRLVDLQLQPAGAADRAELERLHRARVPGRDPVVGHLRSQPDQQHQPDLLPGLPAVLVDHGLDHVRGAARAGAAVGLPGCSRCCSARWCGSSTPPGAGAPAAGSRCASASTTRSRPAWCTAWPAPSRSGCSSTSGRE